jgi:hypothetical protein
MTSKTEPYTLTITVTFPDGIPAGKDPMALANALDRRITRQKVAGQAVSVRFDKENGDLI